MRTTLLLLTVWLIVQSHDHSCRGQRFSFGGPSRGSLLGSLEPLASFNSFDPFRQQGPTLVGPGGGGTNNNGPAVNRPAVGPVGPVGPGGGPSPPPIQGPVQQGPLQYSVELLLVVDKKSLDGWLPNTEKGLNPQQSITEAETRMSKFLHSVIHGVNTLYASLVEYGLYLDVRITGEPIYIHQQDSIWSQQQLVDSSKGTIATDTAIDSFYNWSWRTRSQLPAFDHAILITGWDLVDPRNVSRPTTGVAYKGVMCKFGSVSVVESTYTYQLVDTVAHELGHSLGCDHDGERNQCNPLDGHVMSPRTEVNSTNRWHFSQCSAQAMLEDVTLLERDGENCLQETAARESQGPHLGLLLDADEQCQLLFGDDAYFCRDFYSTADDYHHLCSSMWCSDNHNSSRCESHIASDGFVCGDGMMCLKGECVQDAAAPRVPDDCPQGDQPGIVYDDMTCADTVRNRPWSCYDEFFRRKCCESCPSINTGPAGCEYGNKEGWCDSDEMKYPYDCYLNNQTCCSSCSLLMDSTIQGCEYGDHSSECVTDLEIPLGCYWNEDMCCDTCPKYKNVSKTDCHYGDKSTWCAESLDLPQGCYLNGELCCETCAKVKRPDNEACPYGDRYPEWCPTIAPRGCYNETIREWCCDSCSNTLNPSKKGCEYGDQYENCQDLIYPYACYLPTNAEACCDMCALYRDSQREDCEYGDKQAWCWKLSLSYAQDQWCPLDEENDFCCGSCRYNTSAVPVFGHRLKEEGLEEVTRLGQKFKEEIRESIRQQEEEEKRKKEAEEAEAAEKAEQALEAGEENGEQQTEEEVAVSKRPGDLQQSEIPASGEATPVSGGAGDYGGLGEGGAGATAGQVVDDDDFSLTTPGLTPDENDVVITNVNKDGEGVIENRPNNRGDSAVDNDFVINDNNIVDAFTDDGNDDFGQGFDGSIDNPFNNNDLFGPEFDDNINRNDKGNDNSNVF